MEYDGGNGHDPEILLKFLNGNLKEKNKPNVLIAKTIKGKVLVFLKIIMIGIIIYLQNQLMKKH